MKPTLQRIVLAITMVAVCAPLLVPLSAHAAAEVNLYIVPVDSVATVGDTVQTELRLNNTSYERIDSIEAYLTYPVSTLEIVGVSTSGSAFTASSNLTATYDNTAGTLYVTGAGPIIPTPSDSLIANIKFKTKQSGNARISYSDTSKAGMHGNGGVLRNVLTGTLGSSISITSGENVPDSLATPPTGPVTVRPTSSTSLTFAGVSLDSIILFVSRNSAPLAISIGGIFILMIIWILTQHVRRTRITPNVPGIRDHPTDEDRRTLFDTPQSPHAVFNPGKSRLHDFLAIFGIGDKEPEQAPVPQQPSADTSLHPLQIGPAVPSYRPQTATRSTTTASTVYAPQPDTATNDPLPVIVKPEPEPDLPPKAIFYDGEPKTRFDAEPQDMFSGGEKRLRSEGH